MQGFVREILVSREEYSSSFHPADTHRACFGCSYPKLASTRIGGWILELTVEGISERTASFLSLGMTVSPKSMTRVGVQRASVVLASVADVWSHIGHPQ